MLRIVLAAVAGGIALQLWVLGSTYWLPDCAPIPPAPPLPPAPPVAQPSSQLPAAQPSAVPPAAAPAPGSSLVVVDTATPVISDLPPDQVPLPPLPDRRRPMPIVPPIAIWAQWQNVGLAFFVGLVAALMAAALPEATDLRRQCTLVVLMGVFTTLIGRFSDVLNPDEPRAELLACLANQFVGIALVATVAFAIARCPWFKPRLNAPSKCIT